MLTPEIVCREYDSGMSTYQIAKKYHTYANKVRRILIKAGKVLRTKGEAQSNALSSGSHKHPTKGKERSDEVKKKISQKMKERWKNESGRN